jgi:hypothetical protein
MVSGILWFSLQTYLSWRNIWCCRFWLQLSCGLKRNKMVAYLGWDLLQYRLQVCLSLLKEVQDVFISNGRCFVACWFVLKTCNIFHGPEIGTDVSWRVNEMFITRFGHTSRRTSWTRSQLRNCRHSWLLAVHVVTVTGQRLGYWLFNGALSVTQNMYCRVLK